MPVYSWHSFCLACITQTQPQMKKLTLLIIAAVLTANVSAQLKVGLKAGVNISNFSGDDADGAKTRIGFNAGGYITHSFSDVFELQPELIFSSAGSKFEESYTDPDFGLITVKGTMKLTYLNVP